MPRVRQFGQLRHSRTNSKANISPNPATNKLNSSHSAYLCVDCTNHSLSKQKQIKKQSQKKAGVLLRTRNQQNEGKGDQQKRLARVKKVDFERRLRQENYLTLSRIQQDKKQEQLNKRLQERKQTEQLIRTQQNLKTNQVYRQRLLKEQWLRNIQGQITAKEQQKAQQQQQKRRQTPDKDIFHTATRTPTCSSSLAYLSQLKTQIIQDQTRKAQIKEKLKKDLDILAMPLLDQAQQRNALFQKAEAQRKKLLMQEAKKKRQQKFLYKIQKKQNDRVEREYYQAQLEMDKIQVQQKREQKKQVVSSYISQVKEQIQIKKEKQKFERQAHLRQRQEPFSDHLKRKMSLKNCDSCEKPVQKMLLTRFQDPL